MKPSKVTGWIVPVALITVLLAAPVIYWGDDIAVYWRTSELRDAYKEQEPFIFGKAWDIMQAAGGPDKGPPATCRAGKCVFVSVVTHINRSSIDRDITLDADFGRLPPELCAPTPAEVRTVVLLNPESHKNVEITYSKISNDLAMSTRRENGRISTLECQIVDLKTKRYLGRKVFTWPETDNDEVGSSIAKRNSQELVEWYKSLQDKQ